MYLSHLLMNGSFTFCKKICRSEIELTLPQGGAIPFKTLSEIAKSPKSELGALLTKWKLRERNCEILLVPEGSVKAAEKLTQILSIYFANQAILRRKCFLEKKNV